MSDLPQAVENALWLEDFTYLSHELDEPGVFAVVARDEDGTSVTVFVTEFGEVLDVTTR